MIRIRINAEQHALLMHPIQGPKSGWGGWQHLLSRLQQSLIAMPGDTFMLRMTKADAGRVLRYSQGGNGGFQRALQGIAAPVAEALRHNLEEDR